MAYRYTDVDTRTVYSRSGGLGGQTGKTVKFWANSAGTVPIDVGLYSENTPSTPGATTGTNTLEVRSDQMWPEMWDRVGANPYMWIQVGTASSPGDLYKVYADSDQRIVALQASLSDATEAAQEGADAAQAAAVAISKTYVDELPQRIPFGAVRIDPDLVAAAHAAAPQTTPTYDGIGQAVHPAVYYNPLGWGADSNGKSYRYWMAMTPYPNGVDTTENPSILASDDGVNWVVPPGLTNPIDSPTVGFYPDPDFIDIDGTLWCIYAVNKAKFSTDGITWSARQSIAGITASVSTTVLRIDGVFWTWGVRTTDGTPYRLHLQKATSMVGPYGTATICTFPVPANKDLWHIQVRRVGDSFVAVAAVCDKGTTGTNTDLYFATSADGVTWDVGSLPLLQPEPGTWTSQQIYRSAIVPYDGRDGALFGLWYTGVQTPDTWRIGYTEITSVRPRAGLARTDRPNTIAAGQVVRGDARNRLANPSLLVGASGAIVPTGYANNLVGFSGHAWDEATESFTALRASGTGPTNIQLVHTDTFVEGEVWTASVEAKISDPNAGAFGISTQWLTSGDVTIGSATIAANRKDTDFRRIFVTSTVPATAAKLRITISSSVTANPIQFWWRRAQLEKAAAPTTYAPNVAVSNRAASGQIGNVEEWQTALASGSGGGARVGMAVTKDARLKSGAVNEQTTVGATGPAAALPSQPLKYLRVELDDGTQGVIPVYRQA